MANRLMVVAAATLLGCGVSTVSPLPAWIDALIAELEAEPVTNPPRSIVRRVHEAGAFYYVPGPCCDFFSDLYDEEGQLVCHPDGGIAGGGDGLCPELGEIVREDTIWTDSRGKTQALADPEVQYLGVPPAWAMTWPGSPPADRAGPTACAQFAKGETETFTLS